MVGRAVPANWQRFGPDNVKEFVAGGVARTVLAHRQLTLKQA
jgi:hypothetical protein